jgi:hypothetical protein
LITRFNAPLIRLRLIQITSGSDPRFGLSAGPQSKITPEQVAKVDYIISVTEFKATVLRSPNGQK